MKFFNRNKFLIRFGKGILGASLFALLTACELGFSDESFQNKAGAYFKEMTSTAAVVSYSMDMDSVQTDKYGNICLDFESDRSVTFSLRNPQHYSFVTGQNMSFILAGNIGETAMPLSDTVTLVQDESDTTKICLTFPSDFLKANPLGANISPTINLAHPVSLAAFSPYNGLKLSSNAVPPMPSGAITMQTNESPSRWVVCFNLPNVSIVNKYHSDIASVDVNGNSAAATISNGSISLESGKGLEMTAPSGLMANQNTGLSFIPNGQAVYYNTGDEANEEERVYEVKVTDNAGLVSSYNISTRGMKLSAPSAYLTDDANYANAFNTNYTSDKNFVSQEDDGSSFINLRALAKTQAINYTDSSGNARSIPQYDYDSSNAKILYEVYLEDTFTTLVNSGTISGLSGKIPIPAGTSYVRAYVRKPLYSDSEVITWWCRAVSTRFYVSETGDDTMNTGAKDSPYRTVQKAIDTFKDGIDQGDYDADCACQIKLLTDITPPADFDFTNNGDAFIKLPPALNSATVNILGDGGTKTINADRKGTVVKTGSGTLNITDINLTGGYTTTSSAVAALIVLGGHTSVNGGEIYGNEGAYVIQTVNGGTTKLTMNSVKVHGNKSPGSYSEITGARYGGILHSNVSEINCNSCMFYSNETTNVSVINAFSGKTIFTGGSITGNTSTYPDSANDGVVCNKATLTLDGVTITGNSLVINAANPTSKGAVFFKDGVLKMKGANIIANNTINVQGTTSAANLYLAEGKKITVTGSLAGSNIGIACAFASGSAPTVGTPTNFTNGYGAYNTAAPGNVFVSDMIYGVALNGSGSGAEAAFAVSSGAIYTAFDYNFTFALKEADGTTGASRMYQGKDATFVVVPTVTRAGATLYLNPANRKLYLEDTYQSLAAGDNAVSLTGALYSGSTKTGDLEIVCGTNKITVTVPAAKNSLPDTYTIKVNGNFLGVDHDSSASIVCDKSALSAASYIASLTTAGVYDVVVEGGVSSDATSGDLAKVATAIKTHGSDSVYIRLDASGTSKSDSIASYNDGQYFKNCTALKSMLLPDWMEFIIHDLFNGCTSLESVTLPDSVEYIGQNAFNGCVSLTSISLPAGISGESSGSHSRGIDANAFNGCTALATINYAGTTTQWSNVNLGTGWNTNVRATVVHCSNGDVNIE